ncbi:IclR family transcriptional regulator [Bosea sp. (in: a-proteobacteria)]|uniref:IclR family transcriptional regulator n=1 Tax=Bosea sp. (in: a-proteobacteria) TaxID=1871050 RepID=UPI00260D572D|nr:IclR family transcriptional regulator [Bosea sp. (in: a-proteobacteria)]MCO5089461.1 IclR family transcriptional regulator [Bosea sp. (in: a-proteobacteria)]
MKTTKDAAGTVSRVATILSTLAEAAQPLGVKQISLAAELPMSTTHRLLDLLSESGFVQRIAKIHKYSLGPDFLRIAATTTYKNPLHRIVQPTLNDLTERTDETSAFALYHQSRHDISYHAKADSRQPLRFRLPLNQREHLQSNAFGHAVLASLSDAARDSAASAGLVLPKATDGGLLDMVLQRIRDEGYAVSKENEPSGVAYIAAPVRAIDDSPLGAIGLVIPVVRFERSKVEAYGALVFEAAKKIGNLL